MLSACGDYGNNLDSTAGNGITKSAGIVASDSVALTPATVNGSNGKPSLIAASAISVAPGMSNNTFDFVIAGPQRASGGHQSWTDVPWARVSYRGGLGLYRLTIDTSSWSASESARSFRLIANNDAGQTVMSVRAVINSAQVAAPTPAPTPVAAPPPVVTVTPAAGPATSPVTVTGSNGRPTLNAPERITVAQRNPDNVSAFSISGPARSTGGYQAWTNRSWARVTYAGAHGQYRLHIDTSGWQSSETERSLILVANNDSGQTTMPIVAATDNAGTAPVPAPAPQPISAGPIQEPSDDFDITPDKPAPVVTVSPLGTSNSVETVINDMGLPNDGVLDGIPGFFWATSQQPGQISMGADSRGCYAPQWWQNQGTVRTEYKDCDYWNAYVQWFVIFEGVGNAASNVRVETRRPQTWYLSKSSNQWKLLGQAEATSWFLAAKSNLVYVSDNVDERVEDGAVSLHVQRASPYAYHGVWPQGVVDISGIVADIKALYTTVQARLVVDDPGRPDDRAQAFWMLQSGADYYPATGVSVHDAYPPGAGLSRSKRITSQWQSFNFATLNNARIDYRGPVAPLSPAQFRQNPPPMN